MSSVLRPARKRKKVRKPEERVAVMDEDPDVSQESVLGIGGVPHELGDPRAVGLEPGGAVARRRRADDDGRGRLRQGATGGGQDAVFQRVIL